MIRYRLSVTAYSSSKPLIRWTGGFTWDAITGITLDCPALPPDVARAVLAGLRKNGHHGDGCMLADGRYI